MRQNLLKMAYSIAIIVFFRQMTPQIIPKHLEIAVGSANYTFQKKKIRQFICINNI